MIWVGIALLVIFAVAWNLKGQYDWGFGVFMTTLLALMLCGFANMIFMYVGDYDRVEKECNLAPVVAGGTSYAAVTNETFYFRCEGDNNFAPISTDEYDTVKVFYSDRAHVVSTIQDRNNYFWSLFNSGEVTTKIYLPNNVLATAVDNPAAK